MVKNETVVSLSCNWRRRDSFPSSVLVAIGRKKCQTPKARLALGLALASTFSIAVTVGFIGRAALSTDGAEVGPTPTTAAVVIDTGAVGADAGTDTLARFRDGWAEVDLFFFRLLVCFGA